MQLTVGLSQQTQSAPSALAWGRGCPAIHSEVPDALPHGGRVGVAVDPESTGLLSTRAMVDRYEPEAAIRAAILSEVRRSLW
jgi:hypothetical protein